MEQNNVQNVENNTTTENVATQTTEQNEVKTLKELLESNETYQKELNTIIQDRLDKAKKNMPSKDELKAFNDWKESQKTDAEKQNEIIEENKTLKAQLMEAENKTVVANAGVDSKFQKFVMSEVSQLEGDFKDNLDTYLKDNPQYLFQKEKEKTTTGFPQTSNKTVSEDKAYLDKKYANNPYYKK